MPMATYRFTQELYLQMSEELIGGKGKKSALVLVSVALLFLVSYFTSEDAPIHTLLFGLMIPIVLLAMRLLLKRFLRRSYEQQAALQEEIQAEFNASGTQLSQASGNHQLPWERVLKWKETKGFLYLYENPQVPIAVPKAALADEELNCIRSALAEHKLAT